MAKNQFSNGSQNLESIPISSITLDHEIQSRCQIDDDVVAKYAAAMRQGEEFPPVIVFFNGTTFWLADGFHRLRAKEAIGDLEILADVMQGNPQEAVLHAIEANLKSELKLTEADIDKNSYKLIGHPEWKFWSDKEIADLCGTNEKHIYQLREQRLIDLYNMVVEMNKINDPTPKEPLKAKHFDLESALNMDSTTFGPLISDCFLRVWVDMMIDNCIKEQREASTQSQN